jgi:hypothetical protein
MTDFKWSIPAGMKMLFADKEKTPEDFSQFIEEVSVADSL